MADKPQQGFLPPLLHGSSYIRNRNIFIQNLLKMPFHQVNGNPTNTNTVNSSTGAADEKDGPQPQLTKNLARSIVRGTFNSVVFTAVAPIDRVQYLMQCQNELIKTGRLSSPYKGMKDCFLRTIKHEGFFSLWRGNSVNLLSVFAFEALFYLAPEVSRRYIWDAPSSRCPVTVLLANLVHYPFLYTRVRLANDVNPSTGVMRFSLDCSAPKSPKYNAGNSRQFSGPFDVIKKTLMYDGFCSLYRGFAFAFIGIFAAAHLSHEAKEYFTASKRNVNQETHKFLAKIALSYMLLVSVPVGLYPFRTVSYRMMMTSGEANKYKGPANALYQIVKKEGWFAFYKGATPYFISQMAGASITVMLLYSVPFSKIALIAHKQD